jgi:hypothetical protein
VSADSSPFGARASDLYLVRAAVAPMLREPRISSEQISQRVAGHVVQLLEGTAPWLRVRGEDEYAGWMHEGYLHRGDPSALTRVSLGCVVRDSSGRERPLPLGARLAGDDRVESGTVLDDPALRSRFPRDARAIAASACTLFTGAPYEWGGITPWGADCSGFVQTIFALHGVPMPRDASQQGELGVPAPDDLSAHAPADLLFFSDRDDGKVTHVGIACGDGQMAHVALGRGGFAIDRMRSDESYVRALRGRFRFARRLLS